MQTQDMQITLRGATFQECITQARALVEAAGDITSAPTATRATKRGRPAAVEVEETEELMADEAEETETLDFDGEEEEAPAKTTKGRSKKLTSKDVNQAAMEFSKVHGRPKTLNILQKKFKVKSILELKDTQYADVIAALEV